MSVVYTHTTESMQLEKTPCPGKYFFLSCAFLKNVMERKKERGNVAVSRRRVACAALSGQEMLSVWDLPVNWSSSQWCYTHYTQKTHTQHHHHEKKVPLRLCTITSSYHHRHHYSLLHSTRRGTQASFSFFPKAYPAFLLCRVCLWQEWMLLCSSDLCTLRSDWLSEWIRSAGELRCCSALVCRVMWREEEESKEKRAAPCFAFAADNFPGESHLISLTHSHMLRILSQRTNGEERTWKSKESVPPTTTIIIAAALHRQTSTQKFLREWVSSLFPNFFLLPFLLWFHLLAYLQFSEEPKVSFFF